MDNRKEKMGKILKFPVINNKLKKTSYKMPKIYKLLLVLNITIMAVSILFLFFMKKLI